MTFIVDSQLPFLQFIAVVCIAAVTALGSSASSKFSDVASNLDG